MPDLKAPSSAVSFIQVEHLTKAFGRLVALDDVSFSVKKGEILGLIGPNGAGKTTLFECIAGLLPADRGAVSLEGRTLGPADRGEHLFYVPDGIAPWPSETVRWALDFAAGFFGGDARRIPDIVGQLGLASFLDARIGTLSKGQRKRAVLGVGLVTPHPLLLVDEPFDGLDLKQTREMAATLRAHAQTGRTLFLSIHQIADAARVCDRFVLLSGGRTRGEGTIEDLARSAAGRGAGSAGANLEEVFLALT